MACGAVGVLAAGLVDPDIRTRREVAKFAGVDALAFLRRSQVDGSAMHAAPPLILQIGGFPQQSCVACGQISDGCASTSCWRGGRRRSTSAFGVSSWILPPNFRQWFCHASCGAECSLMPPPQLRFPHIQPASSRFRRRSRIHMSGCCSLSRPRTGWSGTTLHRRFAHKTHILCPVDCTS
jgi:hypothetical protein